LLIVGADDVLCQKWPHTLAGHFAVDWLRNAPDTDPVAFKRASWGYAGGGPEKTALSSGRKA
jgi:hypothetical protein